ncbi:MAG TPA: cobalamin-binding protein [Pyrinomonadaceae bacterium]|nr:cobalamin-binding protein [Pyrinomonadaceae bacterium]
MKGRVQILAVLVAACCGLLSLASCGTGTSGGLLGSRVVNDDTGRRVEVPRVVKRVVSLAPSVTENVFAVGAGDRLVGVTTFCNYPEQAKSIAKVGDTMTPNMETIVALKPDIVFVSSASQLEAFTKTLEENQISVYVTDPKSLDGLETSLIKLGQLLGTTTVAEKLVKEIKLRETDIVCALYGNPPCGLDLAKPVKTTEKMTVFVQVSKEPLFTIGKDAFLNSVITFAGGASVTADVETAFPKLSKETASALNPEAIILSDSEDNQEPNEAFKNSPAVKNGRVYKVNADILSRPGPRLVDALEQIAKDLHPEKFL